MHKQVSNIRIKLHVNVTYYLQVFSGVLMNKFVLVTNYFFHLLSYTLNVENNLDTTPRFSALFYPLNLHNVMQR